MPTTTNKLFIYRLLDIPTGSAKILLLLFPPIYAFWLLAIGKLLLQKQNKNDKTFTFFASGTIAFFIIAYFIAPLLQLFQIDISVTGQRGVPIALTIFIFWFGTIGMLSNITIKYERMETPEKYYTAMDNLVYIGRFLTFFYWFIGFWFYQKTVNKYNR